MTSTEARLRVLKLVQEGKISPEDGLELLQTLEDPGTVPFQAAEKKARWLRIRVTDTNTKKIRVNVRLPLNVVTTGLKMGARFSPEVEGLDMNVLAQMIQSGSTGLVTEVYDELDGEHVEVFLE